MLVYLKSKHEASALYDKLIENMIQSPSISSRLRVFKAGSRINTRAVRVTYWPLQRRVRLQFGVRRTEHDTVQTFDNFIGAVQRGGIGI